MPGFTESSITLNFPDNNYFRFADCPGYRKFSGNNFKEMDACWHNAGDNIYWLIELKDYTADLTAGNSIESRVWNILKKAVDSISMFLSVKHQYAYGQTDLQPCMPVAPDAATNFSVFTVVHCPEANKADIQLLHNSFRSKFMPYAKLFGITSYGVLEHTQAMRVVPNNIVQ
jgi:hypothetical protein